MERFIHSLKVFWRAERLLKTNELRLNIKKVQVTAVASLVGLFGLVMLTLAVFFALVPVWGSGWLPGGVCHATSGCRDRDLPTRLIPPPYRMGSRWPGRRAPGGQKTAKTWKNC